MLLRAPICPDPRRGKLAVGQRRMLWRLCSALALTASLVAARRSSAQQDVQVPDGCGSRAELSSELVRLLGARAVEAEPLSLRISERGADQHHHLRLELRGEVRELTDPDCRALFRSAIVIAATAVNPHLYDPPPREPPTPSQDAEHGVELGIFGGVGAAAGVLPGVAVVFEPGARVRLWDFGAYLAIAYLPSKQATEADRGVDIWGLGGRAGLSFQPIDVARLSAGVAVDRLEGRGFGVAQSMTDAVWSVAPTLEAGWIPLRTARVELELAARGHIAVTRPRFEIEGFGEIYRAPRFGGALLGRVAWLLR